MKKLFKKSAAALLGITLAAAGLWGCKAGNAESQTVQLTFQIWDNAQRGGMENLAAAYEEKNPGVSIEVQVTSWDEYWTKLEAAAESNQLPDIFWMHTNEILKYADYGMLADLTDLYDDVSPSYYADHFSDISLDNAKGSNGLVYGVPKDKDSVALIYNREMFDGAGVSYPDESWTWDDLTDASRTIYEKLGKYGYLAYGDDQLGYWNFVYQAGGYILNEEKTRAGFQEPGTKKGMEFYIGLQKNDWCPDQNYFAQTNPGTAFMSEQGAMYLEGNWNFKSMLENNRDMIGKWDVAVLPKCPDPVKGDGRASISNGLCYSTGAKGKKLDYAKDFLKFLGSEEGQRIQGESGVAIPAYEGLEEVWINTFDQYDYRIQAQKSVDMLEYGVQSVNNASRPNWKSKVNDILIGIYGGTYSLEEGLDKMQETVDNAKRP